MALERRRWMDSSIIAIAPWSSERGALQYDPIIFSYDLNKTFGQTTLIEKDSVSHRGRALMSFLEYYKNEHEK